MLLIALDKLPETLAAPVCSPRLYASEACRSSQYYWYFVSEPSCDARVLLGSGWSVPVLDISEQSRSIPRSALYQVAALQTIGMQQHENITKPRDRLNMRGQSRRNIKYSFFIYGESIEVLCPDVSYVSAKSIKWWFPQKLQPSFPKQMVHTDESQHDTVKKATCSRRKS